jgi:hypothetical protein
VPKPEIRLHQAVEEAGTPRRDPRTPEISAVRIAVTKVATWLINCVDVRNPSMSSIVSLQKSVWFQTLPVTGYADTKGLETRIL